MIHIFVRVYEGKIFSGANCKNRLNHYRKVSKELLCGMKIKLIVVRREISGFAW
uniref:Uncharacterized protein n=1 Tax=Kuenenia stuttgartiensis TaxID=174633 RepID=Q1Q4Z0_KUEST|nr:unknown protein [Candidatus Kuenenia stuttgartiensis]